MFERGWDTDEVDGVCAKGRAGCVCACCGRVLCWGRGTDS